MNEPKRTHTGIDPGSAATPHAADLRVFVAIGDAHTLSEVAAALGLPLHTVSRALKRLERHAETTLVRRGREGVSLTDTGHSYLAACHKILDAHREAEQVLRPEQQGIGGVLRLAAPMEFARSVLSSLLPSFRQGIPGSRSRSRFTVRIGTRSLPRCTISFSRCARRVTRAGICGSFHPSGKGSSPARRCSREVQDLSIPRI